MARILSCFMLNIILLYLINYTHYLIYSLICRWILRYLGCFCFSAVVNDVAVGAVIGVSAALSSDLLGVYLRLGLLESSLLFVLAAFFLPFGDLRTFSCPLHISLKGAGCCEAVLQSVCLNIFLSWSDCLSYVVLGLAECGDLHVAVM